MFFLKVSLMPAWAVGWQPRRLMSIVYVQRSLSSGTTAHISLCRPSSPLMQREHLQAETYSGLYGQSLPGIEGTCWQDCVDEDFCKGIQCSELLGWFLLLPDKYPFEFKSQKPLIIWPCLYREVNSNVLKSNFFSFVAECKTYILLLSCWITSIANTFRSYRKTTFFIFGSYAIPSS